MEMMLASVLFVLATATVGATVIDMNHAMDIMLKKTNNYLREAGKTTYSFPAQEINFIPGIQATNSTWEVVGLDSVVRTGDCTMDETRDSFTLSCHYGLGLLALVLPSVKIQGDDMSAVLRINNNSLALTYNVHHGEKFCNFTLSEVSVERLLGEDLWSSSSKYDKKNIDVFFNDVVVPSINKQLTLHKSQIERYLTLLICGHPSAEVTSYFTSYLLSSNKIDE